MKSKLFVTTLTLLIVIITSCKKENNPVTPVVTDPKVYVAGYWGMKACLWIDGIPSLLSESGQNARAYDIKFSGDDIYICGFEGKYAVYWKNGTRVRLSNGILSSNAENIFISDTNIYIIGSEKIDSDHRIPKLWVNGSEIFTSLENGSFTDIFVTEKTLYLLGWEKTSEGVFRPILWKNGVATYLTDGSVSTVADALFVKDNDVYIAAHEIGDYFHYSAFYWKNSEKNYLPCNGFSSLALSIFVAGNDLYVGGYYSENITGDNIPAYWKNGEINLMGHSADFDCLYRSFFMYNNDMYATGQGYAQGESDKASYSKNDELIVLADTNLAVTGEAIFVK